MGQGAEVIGLGLYQIGQLLLEELLRGGHLRSREAKKLLLRQGRSERAHSRPGSPSSCRKVAGLGHMEK